MQCRAAICLHAKDASMGKGSVAQHMSMQCHAAVSSMPAMSASARNALVVFGELILEVLWIEAALCVIAPGVTSMLGLQFGKCCLSRSKQFDLHVMVHRE